MDILFVGTLEPHPGGSATVNSQVVRGLAARGHRITAVAPVVAQALAETTMSDGEKFPRVRIRRYVIRASEIETQLADPEHISLERAALARTLADRQLRMPDVVLAGRESFARYLPEALWWGNRVPMAITAHSTVADGALGLNANRAPSADLRRKMGAFQRIILVAHHQMEPYGRLGVPMTVVPNGIELERFHPGPAAGVSFERSPGDIVVLHVSNLKASKRPLDLVDAAAAALGREPRLRFVIAGAGTLDGQMREAAATLGIEDRFTFLGWVPRNEIADLYRQADIVVLMSEREALPCTVLEAMATAKCVLASDIPGTRELLVDGETGVLYPVGDIDRLAAEMVRLAAESQLRDRMGHAARQAAETRGLEAVIDGYEACLESVAAEGAPPVMKFVGAISEARG